MKKLVLLNLFLAFGSMVYAANTDKIPANCEQIRKQVKENHDNIDKAYHANDACTMGKLMINNRQVIESNMACFPKLEQIMEQRQKLQSLPPAN